MRNHQKNIILKDPSSFLNEKEFIEYFMSLGLDEKKELAEKGSPIAQRLLATYLHDHKNPESFHWWIKAANVNEPYALFHMASFFTLSGDLSDAFIIFEKLKSTTLLEKLDDFETAQEELKSDLSDRLLVRGIKKSKEQNIKGAVEDWTMAKHLGNAHAAYQLAAYEYTENKDLKKSSYLAKLCLFLSGNSSDPMLFRALAHSLLAQLLSESEESYKKFEILIHLKKAKLYSEHSEDFEEFEHNHRVKNRIESVLRKITDETVREHINKQTDCILMSNNIANSFDEVNSTLHNQEKLTSYPMPKLIETQEEPEINITTRFITKFGIFMPHVEIENIFNKRLEALISPDISNEIQPFITAINEKAYNKALRRVCTYQNKTMAIKLVDLLLQYKHEFKIDVNESVGEENKTALYYAAYAENDELCQLLVKHGAISESKATTHFPSKINLKT